LIQVDDNEKHEMALMAMRMPLTWRRRVGLSATTETKKSAKMFSQEL
jgi:hypothetical protein